MLPLQHLLSVVLSEGLLRRHWLVAGFVLIALAFTVVGFAWPKVFTASATVYVEERNIIQPLMQGTAVATTATDRAKIAREVIFSRKILAQVLQAGGWITPGMSELEQERTMEAVKARTRVVNVGSNLVRIEFQDKSPQRAFQAAQRFADLFIHESASTQTRESADAFEFIDSQVKVYHEKLTQAEQALKEFRSEHLDARPGTEAEISSRISSLQASIEKTSLELKEARIRQASLQKQISGEAVISTSLTREGQYVARIAELQTQLDTLRLSYHDTYPDIVRLKQQIEDLRELMEGERGKREKANQAIKAGDPYSVDETVRVSPIYQRLRSDLLDTNTAIETLNARLQETSQILKTELARAKKLYGGEAALAELTRDYEVNRDIYHDLLKRRENARVSKNLDANKQGLTMRIHEPAVLPLQPSGIRFMHFVGIGVILGALVPIGAIVVLQQLQPKVRVPTIITERIGTTVLATIPQSAMLGDVMHLDRSLNRLVVVVLATFAIIAVAGALKYTGGF